MNRNFEQKRQRAFEQIATAAMQRIDLETGLIPGAVCHHEGAHQKAAGWDVRSTAEAALALAMTGSVDLAWKGFAAVLDRQDRDPASFTYGNFFWHSEWRTALDPNAVSFIAPLLAYVLKHCVDPMPAALRDRMRSALALAMTGLDAHRATWGYTNIAMLNMASKMMIGDVLDDERARRIAYWDWEEWRNHTARLAAIPEYNSLCYTTVQIHGLAMMLACKAAPDFHAEVRAAMRHLITASVCDYHPGIGRITGPQSRAYESDRRLRGASGMDTVLHFVLGTPEPAHGCHFWLGVPIGPEDLLPEARTLPLPRTTVARTHGFVRMNFLGAEFALGSISGTRHLCGAGVPFFVAYRAASPRCTVAFVENHKNPAAGHFSTPREGSLLAGSVFLFDRQAHGADTRRFWWEGKLSGLNTGRPGNVISDPDARPGYTVELGRPNEIVVLDAKGRVADPAPGKLRGAVVVVDTESVCVGLRFFTGHGRAMELALQTAADGELVLEARGTRENGVPVSTCETAACTGVLLYVVPKTAGCTAAEVAARLAKTRVRIVQGPDGWTLSAPALDGAPLRVQAEARPPTLYETTGLTVTPNVWAASLHTA